MAEPRTETLPIRFKENLDQPLGTSEIDLFGDNRHKILCEVYFGRLDQKSFPGQKVFYGLVQNEQQEETYATFVEKNQ